MREKFQVSNGNNDGWPICFGADEKGALWGVITKDVQGGALHAVSESAKADAALVCKLLNLYHGDDDFRAKVDAA